MSAPQIIEADKWYWSDAKRVRFSSARRRWEDEAGSNNRGFREQTTYHGGRDGLNNRPSDSLRSPESIGNPIQVPTVNRPQDSSVHTIMDQISGIKSTVQTGPAPRITAAELQSKDILVHKSFVETRAEDRGIGRGSNSIPYRISSRPGVDFKEGNIVQLLWAEPITCAGATVVTRQNGDVGLARMRRFVIITEGLRYSAAIPILTYGGYGVVGRGLIRSDHTVIFSGTTAPRLLPGETSPDVSGRVDNLRNPFIKAVAPHERRLDPNARLNYRRIYQIDQETCEIFVFGHVHPSSMSHLRYNFSLVQRNTRGQEQAVGFSRPLDARNRNDNTRHNISHNVAPPTPVARPFVRSLADPSMGHSHNSTGYSSRQVRPDQLESLRGLAKRYQTDISSLSTGQMNDLACSPQHQQAAVILAMLRTQDPELYSLHASAFRRRSSDGADDGMKDHDDND